MLDLKGLTIRNSRRTRAAKSIPEISTRFKPNSLCGMIAPPGSGGSDLIETLAGVRPPELGEMTITPDKSGKSRSLTPEEVAWVPGDPVLCPSLPARYHIGRAASLLGLTHGQKRDRVEKVIATLELGDSASRSLRTAGDGVGRLAALGCELLKNPRLVVVDGILDGLDPRDEARVMKSLRTLASEQRCVIARIHAARLLTVFDTVMVFHEEHLIFHGASELLCHYFSIDHLDGLFARLAERSADDWHKSWLKHGAPYTGEPGGEKIIPPTSTGETKAGDAVFFRKPEPPVSPLPETQPDEGTALGSGEKPARPGALAQATMSLADRGISLMRTPSEWVRNAAGLALFLVLLGYPMIGVLDGGRRLDPPLLAGFAAYFATALALVGAAFGSREQPPRAGAWRWMTRLGWTPSGWLLGRAVYLSIWTVSAGVLASLLTASLPQFGKTLAPLMVTASLTGIAAGMLGFLVGSCVRCRGFALGIAGLITLVQLPLSGALLAPPHLGELLIKPFLSVHWAWLGVVSAFTHLPSGSFPGETIPKLNAMSPVWAWLFLAIHAAAALSLAIWLRTLPEKKGRH